MEKKEYGENFQQHLLEQYKLYVEMADKTSERRNQTNQFYLSILSILIAFISLVTNIPVFPNLQFPLLILSAVGIVLCVLWYLNIYTYKQLNKARFCVIIEEIEVNLPVNIFSKEWDILKKDKYLELTNVEKYIPAIFAALYLVLGAFLFAHNIIS